MTSLSSVLVHHFYTMPASNNLQLMAHLYICHVATDQRIQLRMVIILIFIHIQPAVCWDTLHNNIMSVVIITVCDKE